MTKAWCLRNFLAFSLVCGGVLVLPAFASTASALTITPRVELEADPGETIQAQLKIANEERTSRTFYLRTENFNSEDEFGNPSFTTRREGLSTWVQAPLSITLGPLQAIEIPIQISVPADAYPGGHYAALFFLSEPPQAENSGDVALSSKLGSLILLRVNGDFAQGADILEFNTLDDRWFYSMLPVGFVYRFQNTGDDHLKPIGEIQVTNLIGQKVKILAGNPVDGNVLPKSVRRFSTIWTEKGGELIQQPVIDLPKSDALSFWESAQYQMRNFKFGRYTATLKLAFGTDGLQSDSQQVSFYIVPWQLFLILIPLLIIVVLILIWMIKRYNRYIIKRARAQ